MIEEMRPCPFCEGDNVQASPSGVFGERRWYAVICPDCGVRGPYVLYRDYEEGFNAREQAIALWNDMPRDIADKQPVKPDERPVKPDEVTAPAHYAGDGAITCKDAMASMAAGYGEGGVTLEQAYWSISALKYLWRWPLKGSPLKDLQKARECIEQAIAAVEGGDRE